MSIDIEGDEIKILESIDFNYFDIKVVSVENNNSEQKIFSIFLKIENLSILIIMVLMKFITIKNILIIYKKLTRQLMFLPFYE